ncbi:MAG TPA: hypothetical protein VNV66_08145 [Pilimelia sp.]|nr:hypothetical protein [Pilimelia sp.]
MRLMTGVAVAGAVAGGVIVAVRVSGARRGGARAAAAARRPSEPRWHVLTVHVPAERVMSAGGLPEPLARLRDAVEVRLRPAPGGRGTEIAVRLRAGEPSGLRGVLARLRGRDPRWAVRRGLRETRSLLETGEVLRPSQPPTTRPTLLSRPLAFATRHGREEGLL